MKARSRGTGPRRPNWSEETEWRARHIDSGDAELVTWEHTCALELSAALPALGMVDAFDPTRADLTGMTAVRELFVSEVFHKAFVAIDERGTEAAAATAVVIELTSLRIVPPADLTVDRPFLLAIEHEPSSAMLFLGRVIDPTA